MAGELVTVPELINHMNGIELSAPQQQAAERILAGLQSQLERWLRRPITVRTFTRTATIDHGVGLFWTHTPLISVTSIEYQGDTLDPTAYSIATEGLGFGAALGGYPYPMTVTYVAGIDGRSDDFADLRLLVMNAAARGVTHRHDNTMSVRGLDGRVQAAERNVDPNEMRFSEQELEPYHWLRRKSVY